ncbi:hypothetical protein [Amycolatopsis sp. NPDC051372]
MPWVRTTAIATGAQANDRAGYLHDGLPVLPPLPPPAGFSLT